MSQLCAVYHCHLCFKKPLSTLFFIAVTFTAALGDQIEWLIVKGIADYADGAELTATSWRPFASVMAASVVSHILSDPPVFSSWPHYGGRDSQTRCRLMVFMDEGILPQDLFHHVFYPFFSQKKI